MSLWTPAGEYEVRPPSEAPAAPEEAERRQAGGVDPEAITAELLATPAADIIANHCVGLFQLAALHLGQSPPRFDEARLAIDALGALVENLAGRLGPDEQTLRHWLADVRLAYVEASGEAPAD